MIDHFRAYVISDVIWRQEEKKTVEINYMYNVTTVKCPPFVSGYKK